MATFIATPGYRHILPGQNYNDWINTYTGKVGVYSNWSLMTTDPVPLTGMPLADRLPGGGAYVPGVNVYGEGDVMLSRMFLGLDKNFSWAKNSLVNPGNPVRNDFYGRYISDYFRGVPATRVFSPGYGHVSGGGPLAAYAEWSNYIYSGLAANEVLDTSNLGHAQRYPQDTEDTGSLGPRNEPTGPAESFGAFEPYLYKGMVTTKSDPMGPAHAGHPYWAPSVTPDLMPADYGEIPPPRAEPDHYGQEHTMEWFGVPSARAL